MDANPASMFSRRIDGDRERIEELPRPSDANGRPPIQLTHSIN
jgi:hypothetical protein